MESALSALENTASKDENLSAIGLAWLSLAKMVLHLAIPDVPIDPAAVRHCEHQFIQSGVSLLSEQISLHRQFDQLLAGNTQSVAASYLEGQRDRLQLTAGSNPRIVRQDVSRLHMFWSEVTQFQNTVSSAKIDELLLQLQIAGTSALAREESMQQTIHSFVQRLETAYADFEDLGVIVQFALQHLRMGLRILRHAFVDKDVTTLTEQFAIALTIFPSIKSVPFLMNSISVPSGMGICQHHLLALSAVSFEICADVAWQKQACFIRESYDRIIRLWLMDQEKAKRADEEAHSLYRRTDSAFDDLTDQEREEMEFRALFPSFEDVFDEDSTSQKPSTSSQSLVSEPQMKQLLDLHYSIIYGSRDSPEKNLHDYFATRMQCVSDIQLQSLSGAIDECRIFQLKLLSQCLPGGNRRHYQDTPINFYTDANIEEVKKAVAVVTLLHGRLQQLIEEWPEQMVLHHLQARCDSFLSLNLDSPVAKVLSGLEQLLLQTEDWELFANRNNNLKPERAMLIDLIVKWRRMELSCWDNLLDSEHLKFQGSIAEWWFRLYDTLVRGSLDTFARGRNGDVSTSDYLSTLLPMLDEFIRGSPLGQFASRLKLVESFALYCQRIIPTLPPSDQPVIARVQCLLKSTWESFDLYSPAIEAHLQDQRSSLEKEVKNFVKLASWKDINVQALKASAQRTHHQLYKIIRKFRDILRLPAADRLLPQFSRKEDDRGMELLLPEHPSPSTPTFPTGKNPSAAPHLVNLDRTYTRFADISHRKLRAFVTSALPLHVEGLATDIITGIQSLSSLQTPPDISPEKRTKFFKSVLTRKRKAWSDLLKELKRAGFATNLKPEVLQQHQDSRWLREQPTISLGGNEHSMPFVRQADNYFRRLEGGLKQLRSSIPGHHSDLTTRELQRGHTLLESCFGMAVEARAR